MILDAKSMAWQLEVVQSASRSGWTCFDQTTRNRRQHAPSLILVRGTAVILVWLRTRRADAAKPIADTMGKLTGLPTVVWTPADWPEIRVTIA